MQALLSKLLGASPKTSMLGVAIAALGIIHEALKAGESDWMNIAMAVLMGVLGLKASDGDKK
jgi:EamA domain-containing membrane protein RarD